MQGYGSGEAVVLSVVVPAYNEAEVVYVNDGSTDNTLDALLSLRAQDPRVAVVTLSRNFGKELALTAGLDHAQGSAVVVIDADLQDPPELIPDLVKYWSEGYHMVYAQRVAREGETWFKKATAHAFYRVIQRTSRVTIPADTGDFRLLSRRAVNSLKQLHEQHRFLKGLFAWIGYPQKAVPYRRDPRFAGASKWNYWRLWNLALEGITSFTIAPLAVASYLGTLVALVAFIYAGFIVYDTLVSGNPVAGYPSLIVVVLFLGGIQLITLGIIGEYLGRVFDETKGRPLYIVQDYHPSQTEVRERVAKELEG